MNKLMLSLLLGASVLGFQAVAMDLDDDIHCTPMSTQSTAPQIVQATQPLRNRLSETHLQWLKNNWRGPPYKGPISDLFRRIGNEFPSDLPQPPSLKEFAKIPVDSLRALAPLAARLYQRYDPLTLKVAVLCYLSRVSKRQAICLVRRFLGISCYLDFDYPSSRTKILAGLLANGGQRLNIFMREAGKLLYKGISKRDMREIISPLAKLQDSHLLRITNGGRYIFAKMRLRAGLRSTIVSGLISLPEDRVLAVAELAPQLLSKDLRDNRYNLAILKAAGERKPGQVQEAVRIFQNGNYSAKYRWVFLKTMDLLPQGHLHFVIPHALKAVEGDRFDDYWGDLIKVLDRLPRKSIALAVEDALPLFRKDTSVEDRAKIIKVLRKAPHDRVAALRAFAPSLEVIDEDNRVEVIKSLLEVPAERIPVVYRDAQDLYPEDAEGEDELWILDSVISSTPDKILAAKKYAPILLPDDMHLYQQSEVLQVLIDSNEKQLALVAEYAPKLYPKDDRGDGYLGRCQESIITSLCGVPMDLIPRITKHLLKDPKRLNDSGDKIGDLIQALAKFPPEQWDFVFKHLFDYVPRLDESSGYNKLLAFIRALKGLPLERMKAIHGACSLLKGYFHMGYIIEPVSEIPADRLLEVVCEAPKLFASGWDPHNARQKIIEALSKVPKDHIAAIVKKALARLTGDMGDKERLGIIEELVRPYTNDK